MAKRISEIDEAGGEGDDRRKRGDETGRVFSSAKPRDRRRDMNGFLVELVHTMDDLPVGLFRSNTEALKFAATLKPMPTERIRKIFSTDASSPVGVNVAEFRGGVPVQTLRIKDFF